MKEREYENACRRADALLLRAVGGIAAPSELPGLRQRTYDALRGCNLRGHTVDSVTRHIVREWLEGAQVRMPFGSRMALEMLPEMQREILLRRYGFCQSVEETAAAMGIPVFAVRMLYRMAKASLCRRPGLLRRAVLLTLLRG